MKLIQFNAQDINKHLRKLARSIYWQSLYNNAKEYNIRLFKNDTELTSLQLDFLYFLSYYSNIYSEVAAGVVSEKVIQNDIYIDSYNYYKRKSLVKEKKNTKKDSVVNKLNNRIVAGPNTDQWTFK